MSPRRVQIVFLTGALFLFHVPARAEPVIGQVYAASMVDVNGRKLSTTDEKITTVVIASSTDVDKARTVGDRIPEHCLGNPDYQMVTVLRFEQKHFAATQGIMKATVRHRLANEARSLQARYNAKDIKRDAKQDVLCVADFDETAGSQLGIANGSAKFEVLVLGKKGELLKTWTEVPAAEELAAVLKQK